MVLELIRLFFHFALVLVSFYWALLLLSEYFSKGRYARNATNLLGGLGILMFAIRLVLLPSMAQLIVVLSHWKLSIALVVMSSILLLASIVTYGAITYWKPGRLKRESQIPDELKKLRDEIY